MCKFYVWALDEAFGGDQEQYTKSKYQKMPKLAKKCIFGNYNETLEAR